MPLTALRPTFEIHLPLDRDEADRRIRLILKQDFWKPISSSFERYTELHVPKDEIRFWSPNLSLLVDHDGGCGTRIYARFAPRQDVWTFVWVIYMALTFTAFFAMVYVYAVSLMKQSTWMSVVPILAIIGIAMLHFASRIGQQLSADQMVTLRDNCDLLLDQVRDMGDSKNANTIG
ncbi:MAG: hypothetical protein NTW52_05775 [Planctomycetota bacterium]|nr:hypothetical protein [Planctomycetota bacterium]